MLKKKCCPATTLFAHHGEVQRLRPRPLPTQCARLSLSLSGPYRPDSKQGKVSVMYCIQELSVSDHTDVLVVLVDVGSGTL